MDNVKVVIGDIELNVIIKELIIECKANTYTNCELVFSYSKSYSEGDIRAIVENKTIKIYSMENNEDILFSGYFDDYEFRSFSDDKQTRIVAYSYAKKLDINKKNQSFQNVNQLYSNVITKVIKDVTGTAFDMNNDGTIMKPFIQYNETAWEFIKRLASNKATLLYDVPYAQYPFFMFGSYNYKIDCKFSNYGYKTGIDEQFFIQGGIKNNLSRGDYLYYILTSNENYQIGNRTRYKDLEMIIYEKKIIYADYEWKYQYKLGSLGIEKVKMMTNPAFTGMSLAAKVIDAKAECIKVHFDIDEKQDITTAYDYNWVPFSGNLFYCPPKIGTQVSIYLDSADEASAQAINCIRTNGADCKDMADYSNRKFLTDYGKQMYMCPSEISFSCENGEKSMKLLDNMFSLATNKPFMATANGNLTVKGNTCYVKSIKDMQITRTGSTVTAESIKNPTAALLISGDINCYGNNDFMEVYGERITHPFFDDNPERGSEMKLWGSVLFKAGLAMLAVVAVVAVTVGTAGVGTAAIIGGAVAISAIAVTDIINGNSSAFGNYLIRGAMGALTGAAFYCLGPFIKFSPKFGMFVLQNAVLGVASGFAFELSSKIFENLLFVENDSLSDYIKDLISTSIISGIAGGIFGCLSYLGSKLFSQNWYELSKLKGKGTGTVQRTLSRLKITSPEAIDGLKKLYNVTSDKDLWTAISRNPMLLAVSSYGKALPGDFFSNAATEFIQDLLSDQADDLEEYLNTDFSLDYVVTP